MSVIEPTRIGGKYEVLRELGSGGFATVYLAREVATELGAERLVAIKVLRDDGSVSDARQRFSQEIRVMANLRHPHIVPLFDTGIWDGRPYLVMPYIEGESLAARIKREGKLPVDVVVRMGIQVCEALDCAHKQHLVHRDVKPSNILFDGEGNAWLADFGVARWMELTGEERPTGSSAGAPGTMAYASPEQVAGDRHLDPRSDVYSLGVVLYECLCGSLPFVGARPGEVLVARMQGLVAIPSGIDAGRRALLEHVVVKAMSVEHGERWENVQALADALRARGAGRITATGGKVVPIVLGALLMASVIRLVWAPLRSENVAVPPSAERGINISISPPEGLGLGAGREVQRQLEAVLARYVDVRVVSIESQAPTTGRARSSRTIDGAVAEERSAHDEIRVHVRAADRREILELSLSRAGPTPSRTLTATATRMWGGGEGDPWSAETLSLLVDSVLFREAWEGAAMGLHEPASSVRAKRAWLQGVALLRSWDYSAADSMFASAMRSDGTFSVAGLWAAQSLLWPGREVDRDRVELLLPDSTRLSRQSRAHRRALEALTSGDMPESCAHFRTMTLDAEVAYMGWLGLASCRRLDQVVVRAGQSPSGWAFRGSLHSALEAYRRAFALLPATGRAFQDGRYGALRALLVVAPNSVRAGRNAEGRRFAAMAGWDPKGDTLLQVPYLIEEFEYQVPATLSEAIARNRALFTAIARQWVETYPESPEAWEVLATSQEVDDVAAARASIVKARILAVDGASGRRMACRHALISLRLGIGGSGVALRHAVSLADSLLESPAPDSVPCLASMAVLRKDHAAAVRHTLARATSRRILTENGEIALPAHLVGRIEALTLQAVVTGAGFPIGSALAEVRRELDTMASTGGEGTARLLLAQALSLALATGHQIPGELVRGQNAMVDAQAAMLHGDTTLARRVLAATEVGRRYFPGEDVSLDALLAESSLWASLGDSTKARAWLDGTLRVVERAAAESFESPVMLASLFHVAELRTTLRREVDPEAGRWERFLTVTAR